MLDVRLMLAKSESFGFLGVRSKDEILNLYHSNILFKESFEEGEV